MQAWDINAPPPEELGEPYNIALATNVLHTGTNLAGVHEHALDPLDRSEKTCDYLVLQTAAPAQHLELARWPSSGWISTTRAWHACRESSLVRILNASSIPLELLACITCFRCS